jgi:AcrR family transcriptional regulator
VDGVKDSNSDPRVPLTRDRVLRAALALADRDGFGSLSMRRLGQELGVKAMSLYNHVTDKEDVVDGMIDLVFGEIAVPRDEDDWLAAMRARATSARETLLRHPWASTLMQSRLKPGPATLQHHDTVIGILVRAGFSLDLAAHAFSAMDSYIYGFAQQQQNLTYSTAEESARVAEQILVQLPADRYPHLARLIIEHALKPGYDYVEEFLFGFDLILDGLARRHQAESAASA